MKSDREIGQPTKGGWDGCRLNGYQRYAGTGMAADEEKQVCKP